MDIEDSANVKNTLLATLENLALINLKQAKESYAVALDHSRSDDMKSEGKYDTRAIEAGYLASAKKQRVEQLEAELLSLQRINLLSTSDKVVLGSLVLARTNDLEALYFLCPCSPGQVTINGESITVISPHSPLGKEMLGLEVGDALELETPKGHKEVYLLKIF